jgi:hypothetical protein
MSTILFVDDHHAFRTVFGEVLRLKVSTVLEGGAVDEPKIGISNREDAITSPE